MSSFESFAPRYPLLALKNIVVFPQSTTKIHVGRPRSLDAIEEAMERDQYLVASALRDPNIDEPTPSDVYDVGTLCRIKESDREQGGTIQVSLEGLCRVRITGTEATKPCYFVSVEEMYEQAGFEQENRAWARQIRELLGKYAKLRGNTANELVDAANGATDVGHLGDVLAVLVTEAADRQALLEEPNKLKRLEKLAVVLSGELEVVDLEQKIKDRVREQIDKNQREYYLREQLKAIHDELGETTQNDIEMLRQKIADRGLPAEIDERMRRELARLERMPGVSAEATVVRTYLDWVLSLPWTERTTDRLDLQVAQEVLDADHDSLEHVKERILDFLAVRKLVAERGVARHMPTILCLVGPPGVGKTSLGRSVARAMERTFVRVSLGGVRDEADIRGHRRTYIGAFPGRIIHAIKQAGTMNPVILLDEIDKMSADFRGDPAAAMLEVLDPEQNHAFVDHYLDVPYDLSDVMFITTGNYLGNIPRPLRDRMEIIEIGGYTEEEKIEICRRHLLPKQAESHGLDAGFHRPAARRHPPDRSPLHARGGRALAGAAGRQYLPQGGADRGQHERQAPEEAEDHPGEVGGVPRPAALRHRPRPAREPDRRRHRPLRHRGRRWGHSARRGGDDARPRHDDDHRAGGRCDAGVGARRAVVRPLARRRSEYRRRIPALHRHPHPSAGGRDAEGWPLRRGDDGDGARLRAHEAAGAA